VTFGFNRFTGAENVPAFDVIARLVQSNAALGMNYSNDSAPHAARASRVAAPPPPTPRALARSRVRDRSARARRGTADDARRCDRDRPERD
jgi:hypothetical protein